MGENIKWVFFIIAATLLLYGVINLLLRLLSHGAEKTNEALKNRQYIIAYAALLIACPAGLWYFIPQKVQQAIMPDKEAKSSNDSSKNQINITNVIVNPNHSDNITKKENSNIEQTNIVSNISEEGTENQVNQQKRALPTLPTPQENMDGEDTDEYLENKTFFNTPNKKEVVIVLNTKKNELLSDFESIIVEGFNENNFRACTNLFNRLFYLQGKFEGLYSGGSNFDVPINLEKHTDYICLLKNATINYRKNQFNNITCEAKIQGKIIDNQGTTIKPIDISESGVGFSENDSKETALTHIKTRLNKIISNI